MPHREPKTSADRAGLDESGAVVNTAAWTPRANSYDELERQSAGFREFANSISYAGDVRPDPAPADDDDHSTDEDGCAA